MSKGIPQFHFYERLIIRVLFAWIVWQATPANLIFTDLPAPNGIARLLDLRLLLQPNAFAIARLLLAGALIAYVFRLFLALALPVALFVNVAVNAIANSQGAIQHRAQIVSLVLFAQTIAYFYGVWRRRGDAPALSEDRAIWWSQQTIVAVYLVAGITKSIVTRGRWPIDARWIGVSIAKSSWQSFYDTLNSAELHQSLAVANFAARHGWLVAVIAAVGLLLELGSPVMLINRTWAAAFGTLLIIFHLTLDQTMRLSFIYNEWLLLIFMLNLPYWIVTGGRKIFPLSGTQSHTHDLVSTVDVDHLTGNRTSSLTHEE